MLRSLAGLSVVVSVALALLAATGAQAAQLPPKGHCVTPTLKTVKEGNRQFKSERWFTTRLYRAGCLRRGNPRPFKAFSARCEAKVTGADAYLSRLQQRFTLRLDGLLLRNQPALLHLDRREIALLSERRAVNRQLRNSGGDRRASLTRQLQRIEWRLITVQVNRARINYAITTTAITRHGAAGVWLAYFDGVVHGCLKAFRGSRYLTVMREHFLVQYAAARFVSPPPTRANVAAWSNLLPARALASGEKR